LLGSPNQISSSSQSTVLLCYIIFTGGRHGIFQISDHISASWIQTGVRTSRLVRYSITILIMLVYLAKALFRLRTSTFNEGQRQSIRIFCATQGSIRVMGTRLYEEKRVLERGFLTRGERDLWKQTREIGWLHLTLTTALQKLSRWNVC
jgi:hypothetical protein